MKELDEAEIDVAEAQAAEAEARLAEAIAEAEADGAEVAQTLADLRARLTGHVKRGVVGLDALHDELEHLATPAVPIDRHEVRVREARADAVRARMWVVAAMRDDLKRFGFELGDAVQLADRVRDALDRMRGERVDSTRRFDRIRTSTAEMVAIAAGTSRPISRRKLPRIRLDADIDMSSASNFFAGHSENISDGGVFVATEREVAIGTEVELAFTLPDGVEIRGRGQVRWARGGAGGAVPGLGVQFIDLSGAAQDAVQNFVRMRSPILRPG